MKIAFDWFDTLSNVPEMRELLKACQTAGHECFVISGALPDWSLEQHQKFLDENSPTTKNFPTLYTPSDYEQGQKKLEIMKREGINILFDDKLDICRPIREAGLIAVCIK